MSSKLLLALLLLLFSGVMFSGCRKSDSATPAKPGHATKMGGIRNWHGSHYYVASGIHFPTPVNDFWYLPDTSFAVTIVSDDSIQFLNSGFKYDQADAADKIYFFGTAYYYYQYGVGTGVAYYYAKDSIVYCNGDVHGTSDSWQLKDLYYTY